jgi:hypothetical protein
MMCSAVAALSAARPSAQAEHGFFEYRSEGVGVAGDAVAADHDERRRRQRTGVGDAVPQPLLDDPAFRTGCAPTQVHRCVRRHARFEQCTTHERPGPRPHVDRKRCAGARERPPSLSIEAVHGLGGEQDAGARTPPLWTTGRAATRLTRPQQPATLATAAAKCRCRPASSESVAAFDRTRWPASAGFSARLHWNGHYDTDAGDRTRKVGQTRSLIVSLSDANVCILHDKV